MKKELEDNIIRLALAMKEETGNKLMEKDRFNLEEEIFAVWNVVDDIDLLMNYVGDSPVFKGMDPKHSDEIVNFLLGLKTIYSVKFQNLNSTMEDLTKRGKLT